MAIITINLSDRDSREDMEDYIRDVARMIGRGYTSGHTDRFSHWDSDLPKIDANRQAMAIEREIWYRQASIASCGMCGERS